MIWSSTSSLNALKLLEIVVWCPFFSYWLQKGQNFEHHRQDLHEIKFCFINELLCIEYGPIFVKSNTEKNFHVVIYEFFIHQSYLLNSNLFLVFLNH